MITPMSRSGRDILYVEDGGECSYLYIRFEIDKINITIKGNRDDAYKFLGRLRSGIPWYTHIGAKVIFTHTPCTKTILGYSEEELWALSYASPCHQQRVDALIRLGELHGMWPEAA